MLQGMGKCRVEVMQKYLLVQHVRMTRVDIVHLRDGEYNLLEMVLNGYCFKIQKSIFWYQVK